MLSFLWGENRMKNRRIPRRKLMAMLAAAQAENQRLRETSRRTLAIAVSLRDELDKIRQKREVKP